MEQAEEMILRRRDCEKWSKYTAESCAREIKANRDTVRMNPRVKMCPTIRQLRIWIWATIL